MTEGATRLTLDLLSESEALQLVTGILGSGGAAAEQDAVVELVRYCGRLPLALRVAATHAADPNVTVADVVAELADDEYRLDVLSRCGDERAAVRVVFDWSYRRLDSEHAQAFRRLGLHPGPDFSMEAAAATTGLELPDARRVLGALIRAHLIEPAARRGRYRFHDLLRAYAVDCVEREDTPGEREHARRTLLDWYAHHPKAAHQVVSPAHRDWHPARQLTTHARPEVTLTREDQAWAWLDVERDNLVAAARDADRLDHSSITHLLVATTGMILNRRGRWDDMFDLNRRALAQARRSGDRCAEVHALLTLGDTFHNVAQWQDAHDAYQAALELARVLGDPWLEAAGLNGLGWVCVKQGQFAQARTHLLAALPLCLGSQHGRMEPVVEGNLSAACIELGDYSQALRHAHRSLTHRQQAHDKDGEAYALHCMALAHHGLDDDRTAIALCEQALSIDEHHRHPRYTARTLDTLGTLLRDTGDTTRALHCWREALRVYNNYDDHRAADLRHRLHALEAVAE